MFSHRISYDVRTLFGYLLFASYLLVVVSGFKLEYLFCVWERKLKFFVRFSSFSLPLMRRLASFLLWKDGVATFFPWKERDCVRFSLLPYHGRRLLNLVVLKVKMDLIIQRVDAYLRDQTTIYIMPTMSYLIFFINLATSFVDWKLLKR